MKPQPFSEFKAGLGADYSTLEVYGEDKVTVFHANFRDEETGTSNKSPGERRFCSDCGSALWVWDPRWPELVHPFASAIDTDLPVPPKRTHMMLSSKPAWVTVEVADGDKSFDAYPDESLAELGTELL
ncbi:GFA family protein [Pseudomonadota bacterium]